MKTYIEIIQLNLRMLYSILKFRKSNLILLFGSPYHMNMGDQAQTYCITKWLSKNYPNYTQLVFTYVTSNRLLLWLLKKIVKKQDKIFFHSGYHITDRFQECTIYCNVVELFPNHPIVIFPQTVYFIKEENAEHIAEIFNHHGKVTLMCRDEVSYAIAKKLFVHCRLLLYPDIVTSLIGKYPQNTERNNVLFCIRNDVESYYTSEQLNELMEKVSTITSCNLTDTTLTLSYVVIEKDREKVLLQVLSNYSKYRLIVTDRYHGVIFSLISGTPVIVLSSADHKLSSGVKWFPPSFSEYIWYAHNLQEAYSMAEDILLNKKLDYSLDAYFEKNYYSILKSRLQ